MLVIIGAICMIIGGLQSVTLFMKLSEMSEMEKYLVGDSVSSQLGLFFMLFVLGAVLFIFGRHRKDKENSQQLAARLMNNDKTKCPKCGLELLEGTQECPQCHTRIGGNTDHV